MMYRLVIFDLDGTLIYTIADLAAAVNHALTRLHFPNRPLNEFNHMVGNGIDKLFERALPEGEKSEQNIQRMREIFLPYYKLHSHDTSTPYPGIPQLLTSLKNNGRLLAVASNKFQEGTELVISQFFGDNIFDLVRGLRRNHHPKPHPQMVNQIIQHFNVKKEETLYIGDSNVDMQTAQNAGIDAIGVLWGYRSKEELSQYPHIALVTSPSEILPIALNAKPSDN